MDGALDRDQFHKLSKKSQKKISADLDPFEIAMPANEDNDDEESILNLQTQSSIHNQNASK